MTTIKYRIIEKLELASQSDDIYKYYKAQYKKFLFWKDLTDWIVSRSYVERQIKNHITGTTRRIIHVDVIDSKLKDA